MPARVRSKVGMNPKTTKLVDVATGEIHDLPKAGQERARMEQVNAQEFFLGSRWRQGLDTISAGGKRMLMGVGVVLLVGGGAILGGYTSKITAQHQTDAELAMSLRTAVPVVNALEVAIDPGKYAGKLVDVIMTPTRGGVFKSGKGLYIQESEGSVSLTIFESAFVQFQEAYGVSKPEDIAPALIGKIIRARGTVQSRPNPKDGSTRTSMVVYAPGLIQILPNLPR